ncbi:hypothetical protein ACRALDRAFT_209727 [Sodiomyces alcalophilus JCM 7366]|uniref:uncharacterized protein n=1 Tax=Sodiomyces alcalophilus JCM 7366 TaxID=591952 RepID=UPI0039B5ACF4
MIVCLQAVRKDAKNCISLSFITRWTADTRPTYKYRYAYQHLQIKTWHPLYHSAMWFYKCLLLPPTQDDPSDGMDMTLKRSSYTVHTEYDYAHSYSQYESPGIISLLPGHAPKADQPASSRLPYNVEQDFVRTCSLISYTTWPPVSRPSVHWRPFADAPAWLGMSLRWISLRTEPVSSFETSTMLSCVFFMKEVCVLLGSQRSFALTTWETGNGKILSPSKNDWELLVGQLLMSIYHGEETPYELTLLDMGRTSDAERNEGKDYDIYESASTCLLHPDYIPRVIRLLLFLFRHHTLCEPIKSSLLL